MKPTSELIGGLEERFAHAVIAFVDADGYPMSVATEFEVDRERGVVSLRAVAGDAQPPQGERVNVVFSHIRPQPGIGYDERRYVSLWGPLRAADGGLEFSPEDVQHWDEQEMSFFEYSERGVPQAKRYLERVSEETGREVKPKLAFGWLFLRATRLPFLTATFVPILLGIAVAAWTNGFSWWLALLTLVGGACIHLGLNVANDVFDTTSGADAANVNPRSSAAARASSTTACSRCATSRCSRPGSTRWGSGSGSTSRRRADGTCSGSASPVRSSASSTRHRPSSSCTAVSERSTSPRLRADHGAGRLLRPSAGVRPRAAARLDPCRDSDRARALCE